MSKFVTTPRSCVNGKWTCPTVPCQELSEHRRIPKVLAEEAWKEYAVQGHGSQSLQRLCERGGFGADELAWLLFDRIKRMEHSMSIDNELHDRLTRLQNSDTPK